MAARQLGKYEKLSVARHATDLALARQPGGHPRGLRWDPEAGERPIIFIERYCKHHKGVWAGKPLLLEHWQKEIVRQAFGWFRADGTRRYRTLYIEVPRKNGKSELAAALGLYLLIADGEAGAEIYSSATKKDQARIVWKTAAAMVKASAELRRFVTPYQNSLVCDQTDSSFEALGADSKTLDGLNPHGNIMDELHAHPDRRVWDILATAMGARRQPLTVAITTAGLYEPESIGWQIHDFACKVLDGVFDDDSFFAFIAAADEGDDMFSEAAQQKANPNWDISIGPSYLAKQAEKAKRQPSFLNEYLKLHLNIWTQQVTRWLSLDKWSECEAPLSTAVDAARKLAVERERGLERKTCYGGLDLSTKLDLTALVLEFPSKDDVIDLVCRFWLPEARVAEYAARGQRHYETWVREGWLTTTPGDVVDYEFIRREVNLLAKRYVLKVLAFDPWSATDLAVRLMGDGINMVECRQGYKTLSEPSKDLEARIISKKVRHAWNPIMRWCVANAVITSDSAGNIKPDKERAVERIDGVVAAVMALNRVGSATVGSGGYLSRGTGVVLG